MPMPLRMKSLIALSPSVSKFPIAAVQQFPLTFRSQPFSFTRRSKYFQSSSYLRAVPRINTSVCHAQPLNGSHALNFCSEARDSGEIHVIVGPMFAGKTTTLLRRIESERSKGRSVAIIKSNKDTRYSLDSIVTHDGEKLPCLPLVDLSSFREKFGIEAYDKLEVIGIDEAQFFEDLYDFCKKAADMDGKTLIVAGLDGDYLRRSFGQILDLIPLADSVTKLTARCEVCDKRAMFTLRKTNERRKELIAGADVYMPVCRNHYFSGQVVKEATRVVLDSQSAPLSSVSRC